MTHRIALFCVGLLAFLLIVESRHKHEPAPQQNNFGPLEIKMPKTQVMGEAYGLSFKFKHALWPGMDASNLYLFDSFNLAVAGLCSFEIIGIGSTQRPGEYCFRAVVRGVESPEPILAHEAWATVPVDGIEYVEIPFSVTPTGMRLRSSLSQNIIGKKANPTHSKEIAFADTWFIPAGSSFTATAGDSSAEVITASDIDTSLACEVWANSIDADDWPEYLLGVKYAMSLERICFSGNPINTSAYLPTTWGGTEASKDKLWVEGFGEGSIGFWCSDAFYNGAYVYNSYAGGAINAPLSYDFSQYLFQWMDGTPLPDTLEVYCTGLRRLSSEGKDIGPWHGPYGDLKAMGRVTQKYGCYFWA